MMVGLAIHRRAKPDGENLKDSTLPLPSYHGNTDEDHKRYVTAHDPVDKNIGVWPCKTGPGDREINLFIHFLIPVRRCVRG